MERKTVIRRLIIQRNSIKRVLVSLVSVFIISFFLLPLNSFAYTGFTNTPLRGQEASDFMMNETEREEFHELVANNESTIESVILAAQRKGRDVSLEGVHASECIILHGLTGGGATLIGEYLETGKIEDMIGNDTAILVVYVNESGAYVDSFVFIPTNDPEEFNINGWMELCSGSGLLDDEKTVYFEDGTIYRILEDLGVTSTCDLKIISFIPQLGFCMYFEQENEEFLIPFQDWPAEIKALNVYKVSDLVETYLIPIAEYTQARYEEYEASWREMMIEAGEDPDEIGSPRVAGGFGIPDNLPAQVPVDLNTYFANSQISSSSQSAQKTKPVSESPIALNQPADPGSADDSPSWSVYIILGIILVFCAIVGILILQKRRSAKA